MRISMAMALVTAVCAVIFVPAAIAQTTFATITGVVTDPTGAVIPGVEIEIRHVQTNYVYRTQTNEAGQYTVSNLRDGTFVLRASAPGFQEHVVEQIVLTGRQTRRVDVSLEVGSVDTVVEVTAGASLLETESAVVADTKDREILRALPLTLRRAWDYFTMTPQVERTRNWHISIGGTRNNQSVAAIDGTPINAADGGTGIGPLMDRTESLQELRIDMAQGSADQATPGQVQLISRAGSNEFHGVLSDYYSTPAFRARNPFQNRRSTVRSHLFTASAGGPVLIPKVYNGRDRTFFFWTYEGNFGSAGQTQFNNGVPLAAWRAGDFSRLDAPITDPMAGGDPFPNSMIPASRINSVPQTIQDRFYPLPNFGDPNVFTNNNYRELRSNIRPANPQITTRIDHRFSDRDFIYWRWTAVRWNLDNFDTTAPTIQERRPRSRNMDAMTVAYTHTFSPSLMSESRYGFTRQDFPQEAVINGRQMAQELGLQGLAPDLPDVGGIHRVAFQGLGITELRVTDACRPCSRHRIHNFTQNVSWYRGNHSFKFGWFGNFAQNVDLRQGAAIFGRTSYSSRFTGFPYADFLLGVPTTMQRDFPAVGRDNRRWSHAVYFTDEWKVTPTLTATFGLRWDIHRPWNEADDRMAIFDIDSGAVVVPSGATAKVSPLLPAGFVPIVEAGQGGRPDSLVKTDWNNLAPRIGLAWRPLGPNTVFRGGFGIYYDTAPWQPSSGGAPFALNQPAFTNSLDSPLMLPVAFPSEGAGGPRTFGLPNGIRPDLRIPYSMQYTATIEHQHWDTNFRIGYTGTNTRQGIYRYNINQPLPDGNLFVDKARRFMNFPNILYTDNGAGHQYHGLNFEVERRMKGGLHFQGFYTWAKDIGDLDRGQTLENAFDRARERTAWERFSPHRISANAVWQLPFGKGRRWGQNLHPVAEGFLGGWEISNIVAWETGRFIEPLWTGPDPTGTFFTNNRTRPVVTIRPDRVGDSKLSNPDPDRWFDPAGFAPPPIGRFGNTGKFVIVGPGTQVWHASVAKHFYFKERFKLRLEMLASNVTNTPNYQDPNTNISNLGAVGRVTNVMNRNLKFDTAIPRELQAQIRLEW